MNTLGAVGFGDLVYARFSELSGWKPRRASALGTARHAGPMGEFDLLPVECQEFTEAEAERIAQALAKDLAAFMTAHPETVWSDGPYAAWTMDDGRKYCWLGHAHDTGAPAPAVRIQHADPDGVLFKSEAEIAPLLALRKSFGRSTATVHGNLRQGLNPGDPGYDLPAGTASSDDVDGA